MQKKTLTLWTLALLMSFSLASAEPATVTPVATSPSDAALLQDIFGVPQPQSAAVCATTGWCTCFTNEECQSWCAGQCSHWSGYCNFSQGECGSCVCTAPVC